jgi:hypothetical protein
VSGNANAARDAALLSYMLEHNRSHARELAEAADRIRDTGKREAADLITDAVRHFGYGNDCLEKAVGHMKERGD